MSKIKQIFFILVFLLLSIYFGSYIKGQSISSTNDVISFFKNINTNLTQKVRAHFNQSSQIKTLYLENEELKKKAVLLNTYAYELNQILKDTNSTKFAPNIKLIRTLSYVKIGDYNKFWIDFNGSNKNKIYGAISNAHTAGIIISKDSNFMLILQNDELASFSVYIGDEKIPANWVVSKLGDIASIKTNSFSPVKNPDAQLEHYSIPAYDEQKYPVFESAEGVKSNKYILSKNSVMISKLNPDTKRAWRPMCLSDLAVSSTEFIIFEAFNPAYKDFVFSIIDSAAFSDWMCTHTTGSTNSRQRTTPSATLEFQIALPDEKTITDFCAIVTPMYDTISANICENQKLAQLRDSILPKLMSGELDVSNIDL